MNARNLLNSYLRKEAEIKKLNESIKPILDQVKALDKERKEMRVTIKDLTPEQIPNGFNVKISPVTVPAYTYTKVTVTKG